MKKITEQIQISNADHVDFELNRLLARRIRRVNFGATIDNASYGRLAALIKHLAAIGTFEGYFRSLNYY